MKTFPLPLARYQWFVERWMRVATSPHSFKGYDKEIVVVRREPDAPKSLVGFLVSLFD